MKSQYPNKLWSALALGGLLTGAVLPLQGQTVTALQEGFETDGDGSRYFLVRNADNGELAFFARRQVFSAGTDAAGGTLEGQWMLGASDVDDAFGRAAPDPENWPELGARDGMILFDDVDVRGLGNLKLTMAVAQGEGTFEPDNHFQIQYRFNDVDPTNPRKGTGEWIPLGGFRAVSTNSPGRYFEGPLRVTSDNDPRLTSEFQDWEWDIYGFGETIDIRIIINSNYWEEDYYVDNIRLTGTDNVARVAVSVENTNLEEPATSQPLTVTFTSETPAPAGGLVLNVIPDAWLPRTLPMPETITIPAGQTSVSVTLDLIQDNVFTGTKRVEARFAGEGVSRESLVLNVENTTPKPQVLIMEVLSVIPGTIETDLIGDANGDGVRTYPGDLFVEIVNFEDFPVDISGWVINDDLGPRWVYPQGTVLQPGQAHVTFGGGEPVGVFGGAPVLTVGTSNGFAFNETRAEIAGFYAPFNGEMEVINLPFNSQILEQTLMLPAGNPAQGQTASYTRTADSADAPFEIHSLLPDADNRLFSPGTRPNGAPYFDPANEITVTLPVSEIAENGAALTATVQLSSPAPAGGLELTIQTNGVDSVSGTIQPNEIALDSLTLSVPAGQSSATFTVTPYDDGILDGDKLVRIVVRGGDDILPGLATLTVTDVEPNTFDLIINEVLIDLAGTGLDPNLNGVIEEVANDQFVEIVNNSGFPVILSGWRLLTRTGSVTAPTQIAHTFANGTVLGHEGAVVLFGRITPEAAADPVFAGAQVLQVTNNNGLQLNAGEVAFIDLVNEHGFVVASVEINADLTAQGQSISRNPDLTGALGLHLEAAAGNFSLFSPGTTATGEAFAGNSSFDIGPVGQLTYSGDSILADSDLFGLMAIGHYPFVYNYSRSEWWYLLATSDDVIYLYDIASGAILAVDTRVAGWAYAFNPGTWIRL